MQSLKKIRTYEFFLVFISVVLYVTRRLLQEAKHFDQTITTAELNNVPHELIWEPLRNYNHFSNTVFPIVTGALFFLGGWFVFHYYVFPRFKEKKLDYQLLILLFMSISFVVTSVFLFDFLKLYIRHRVDTNEHIVGIKVYSLFRKLFFFTNSLAAIIIILFYEGFAQFYYFFNQKLNEEKEENFQYLLYFLNISIAGFMILVAITANLPRKNYWYGAIRELALMAIGATTIYFAQEAFYRKVLPYFSSIKSKTFQNGAIYFLFINLIGAISGYFIQFISWLNYAHVIFGFHSEWILQIFLIFVFISIVIAFLRKVFFKEKIELKTQIISKSAELLNLRSQINPHFLFNALNTLYSVSLKENAEKTADGIQKLGDMMRFMLNENHQDRIPLSKEIEYLHNYIDIQRMRIDETHDIDIKVNIQHNERDIFISPMLLNPFVENAFKHGISFRNPSWIYITLTHDAQKLYFKVHNSLHPKQENSPEQANNGIGLENVKKRLELIYPNRHTLDIQVSDNDYFVSLIIGIY